MLVTIFFAFVGVGIIGLAITEVVETVQEIALQKKKQLLETLDFAHKDEHWKFESVWEQLDHWSKKTTLHRVMRICFPVLILGFFGAAIVMLTEEADSAIMATESPVMMDK